jgi:hypothetical protein
MIMKMVNVLDGPIILAGYLQGTSQVSHEKCKKMI